MTPTEWFNVLLLIGAAQGFFMAFLLWQKKLSNVSAVRYLVFLLLLVSSLLAGRVLFRSSIFYSHGAIMLLPDVILFLIGPMIYFFIKALMKQDFPVKVQYWKHFIPAFIHVFILNTLAGMHLEDYWHFMSQHQLYQLFLFIEGAAIVHIGIYLLLSIRYFQHYQQQFYKKYAVTFLGEDLRPFCIAGILLLVFWMGGFIQNLVIYPPDYTIYYLVWFLLVLSVYYLAFKILVSPELLELPMLHPEPLEDSSILPNFDRELEKLHQYMLRHKPFLNPEIKISDLAEQLEVARQDLSRWINQGFQKNFFDFINDYRVSEFIALRQHPDFSDHNTLELAFQCGFNSKSAFNRAFRKVTDHSPRTYFENTSAKTSQANH